MMNRHTTLRLASHVSIVAAALGLGCVVRSFLPTATAAAAAPSSRLHAIAEAHAKGDPAAAAAAASSSSRALARYSESDFEALRARLLHINQALNPLREEIKIREELVASISSVEDFRRALDLLDGSNTSLEFRHETAGALSARLAQLNPTGAVEAAVAIKDRSLRGRAFSKAMEAWAKNDPDAALASLRGQTNPDFRAGGLQSVFRELARRDPLDAMARAKALHDPERLRDLNRTILDQWWTGDPQAALAWASASEGPERKEAIGRLVEVAAHRDPVALWGLVQTLSPDDKPGSWALMGLFHTWAKKDPQAAFEAALTETDPLRGGEILQQLGRTFKLADGAADNGDRSMALLAEIQDPALQQRFLAGLAEGYLQDGGPKDYARVISITDALTDPTQRVDIMRNIGSAWARTDAPAASEWLNTLQAGAERDAAIGEFVRGTFSDDPAAAMTWSASIADPGKRSRRFAELYPQWAKEDPAAASAWLSQQTQLTAADRAALEKGTPLPFGP